MGILGQDTAALRYQVELRDTRAGRYMVLVTLGRLVSRRWWPLGVATLAGLAFIVAPLFTRSAHETTVARLTSELATIDPSVLVPAARDLPRGTRLQSGTYVSTGQAARSNGTSLQVLQRTGREIGFERDFLVPKYGDIDVEIVRFRTHEGMKQAYSYFLTLPAARGLPNPVRTEGVGERAALVMAEGGAFLEFMRGRYYVVVTTVPAARGTLDFVARLSRALDERIRTYAHST